MGEEKAGEGNAEGHAVEREKAGARVPTRVAGALLGWRRRRRRRRRRRYGGGSVSKWRGCAKDNDMIHWHKANRKFEM